MDTAVATPAEPEAKRIPNRYSLVVLAAKRARQIKEGAPPLIDTDNPNALSVALDEIAAGKIDYIEAPPEVADEAPRHEPVRSAPVAPSPLDIFDSPATVDDADTVEPALSAVDDEAEDDDSVLEDLAEADGDNDSEEAPVQEEE